MGDLGQTQRRFGLLCSLPGPCRARSTAIQQGYPARLQPQPLLSEHSYGFRPGRSAHQAVAQAQAYVTEGHHFVVDLDLAKFFDRVHHDRLVAAVAA